MNKINTFLIGAQKAGTTSIYDWLGQHPEIYAPEELKDYHFFTNEKLYKKGTNHINGFYQKESKIKLHCAVNYLYFSEKAAQRLCEYNSESKIIICLRHPVKRAISAYKYFVRTLREDHSFGEAIKREKNGLLHSYQELANNTYCGHSLYLKQIEEFLKYFPKGQLHFVLFEELVDTEQQQHVMEEVLRFLKVNKTHEFQFNHLNFSGQPKSGILNFLMRKSGITKIVKWFLPFKVRKKLGKKIEQNNVSTKKINIQIESKDIDTLERSFMKEIKKLSFITGRNLEQTWNL